MVRPALLSHRFYENVESALLITKLELGAFFDVIYHEDGAWKKSRWERTRQQVTEEYLDGIEKKKRLKWVPAFYYKDERKLKSGEVKEIEQRLADMNKAIDHILNNLSDDYYQRAMMYEAAYRQHQLGRWRPDINQFKLQFQQMIGEEFHVDEIRTMFRIVCHDIWLSNKDHQQHYLKLVVE